MSNAKALTTFAIAILIFSEPTMAQGSGGAGSIQGVLQAIIDILTGTTARLAAILVCIILGYMAIVGRLAVLTVVFFVIGVVLIFGAAGFADLVIGGAGGGS